MIDSLSVADVQFYLNTLCNADLKVDGVLGPKTISAIRTAVNSERAMTLRGSWTRNSETGYRAAEQLVLRKLGFYSGDIDGLYGPLTDYAFTLYNASKWRDQRDVAVLTNSLSRIRYTSYEQMCADFGEPGARLTRLDLPYPFRLSWDRDTTVSRIAIHDAVAASAWAALDATLRYFKPEGVARLGLDIYGGCFSDRDMRNSTKKSTHAWGLAIDFDPERNQLRWDHTKAHLAKPECSMFWEIWRKNGWVSLGKERDYDWMHVQAVSL